MNPSRAHALLEKERVVPGATVAEDGLPSVAVLVPTLDGRERLAECLRALRACRYPREKLTVVVIDNGSRDGTRAFLARTCPDVRVVANERNVGFTRAVHQGAALAAQADVLCLLNNDVRVEADWLRELVSPIARGECAATGARMHLTSGELEYAGGGVNFQGIAVGHGLAQEAAPEDDFPRRCLFACGGAMAVKASAFHALGGLDEEFFAYYDDLDFGWRLWIAGHEVHYVPTAVCHHRRSSTSRRFAPEKVRLLQVRNAFSTCLKNYDDENLDRILPALLALALRRAWVLARIEDDSAFRIEAESHPRGAWRRLRDALFARRATYPLGRLAMADFLGINDVLGRWEHWHARRAAVQRTRQRADAEIFDLFLKPLWCVERERGYVELQQGILRRYGIDALFAGRTVPGPDPLK